MKGIRYVLKIILIFLFSASSNADVVELDVIPESQECLCAEVFDTDLIRPTFARNAQDGTRRLFVGEIDGTIFIYDTKSKQKRQHPFLDLTDRVIQNNGGLDERGLFSLAFHPQFQKNRKFYVFYSRESEDPLYSHVDRVSEFRVFSFDPNVADPESVRVIIEINQPTERFNGGDIFFDVKGNLLISVGDGGGFNNTTDNFRAQDLTNFYGKLLRINVDDCSPHETYSIPRDNPFARHYNYRPEIFAYGFHNPYRCSGDSGVKNGRGFRVFCSDVGVDTEEEIDIIRKGGNYGWNVFEGNHCLQDEEECDSLRRQHEYTRPVFSFRGGNAVIGGYVYRGCRNKRWYGKYLFANLLGPILTLEQTKGGSWRSQKLRPCTTCPKSMSTLPESLFITSFGTDENGELYMLTGGTLFEIGPSSLLRLVDPSSKPDNKRCKSSKRRLKYYGYQ